MSDFIGKWRVKGENNWHESGEAVTYPSETTYEIQYLEDPNYLKPTFDSIFLDNNKTFTKIYEKKYAKLIMFSNITGSQWRFVGETSWRNFLTSLNLSRNQTYSVEFLDVYGYETPENFHIFLELDYVFVAMYQQTIYQQE